VNRRSFFDSGLIPWLINNLAEVSVIGMDMHGRCYLGVHYGTSGNGVIRGFWGGGSTAAASTVKAIHSLTGDSQRAIDFADCSSHKLKELNWWDGRILPWRG
jgi:hypothetical protein